MFCMGVDCQYIPPYFLKTPICNISLPTEKKGVIVEYVGDPTPTQKIKTSLLQSTQGKTDFACHWSNSLWKNVTFSSRVWRAGKEGGGAVKETVGGGKCGCMGCNIKSLVSSSLCPPV